MEKPTSDVLILTLSLDENAQNYFNALRKTHFPPERNYLDAHLTLFHQLPNLPEIIKILESITAKAFELNVSGLRNLGAGVAFTIESEELNTLRAQLAGIFERHLIPQDRQGFRPHITIQNKTSPDMARKLLAEMQAEFKPFAAQAAGLDLWYYLGGPWEHLSHFPFKPDGK